MLDPQKAKQDIEKILDRKEYQAYNKETQNTLQILWSRAKEWLMDQLAKLFPSLENVDKSANILLISLIVIVILLLAIAIILIVRNARRKSKFRDHRPLQTMSELEWSYQSHLAEVQKMEDLGEYTKATRHLFLALLLYFNQSGWLEAKVWKTNWEYYAELKRTNSAWAQKFYLLAQFFDKVTYGEYQIKKEEYEQYKQEIVAGLAEKHTASEG
ncbi:DUF4129 domain-containing protein [Lederbergia sp. NSJ-179]|uniref:DUF4129 domain-containing protein n=1 Tax=Lederbergia sp. NSJ-179 TaxID=2931402 RepID=UPI001FD30006|nr:DUF4129 domain-containing protein [Lederbergia sp. NSJ-179]MCJ7842009.1 DUF4129 domain-containing protein [Lederbergia sp. NSJ-179]